MQARADSGRQALPPLPANILPVFWLHLAPGLADLGKEPWHGSVSDVVPLIAASWVRAWRHLANECLDAVQSILQVIMIS